MTQPSATGTSPWSRYQEFVLAEIRRLGEDLQKHYDWEQEKHDAISKQFTDTRIEIAKLTVKSGMWGAIAGMIPVAVLILIQVFK